MSESSPEYVVDAPVNRRIFAKGVIGLAGASLLTAGIPGAFAQESSTATSPITDTDILNFALNLEYLEGEFYTKAVTGKTLSQADIIPAGASTGPTTGGAKVDFTGSPQIRMIAEQIMHDEQQHVLFLRAALGSAAVKKPAINLDALGFGFNAYQDFLKLARDFEDVGVSAYGGAAPLINNPNILAAAARIALTEAEHAGNIRLKMVLQGLQEPPVDAKDVAPKWTKLFSVDSKGLAIVRSTSEVLHIVYAGGTTHGGFFPEGVNGKIHSA